jgi:hypothetical protein
VPLITREGPPFTGLCLAFVRRWGYTAWLITPYQQGDTHQGYAPHGNLVQCVDWYSQVGAKSCGGKGWILRRRMGLFYQYAPVVMWR